MSGIKVAEIFASLGFKVEGSDLSTLQAFETALTNIASAAQNAAAALRQLASVKIGVPVVQQASSTPTSSGQTPASTTQYQKPIGPGLIPYSGSAPPKLPAPPPSFGSQIFQGAAKNFHPLRAALALGGVAAVAYGLVAAVKTATSALIRMTTAAMNAAVSTDKFTVVTGLSRDEMNQARFLANQANISDEEILGTLRQLQQDAKNIGMGLKSPAGYIFAGINPNQDSMKVLREFRDAIKDKSEQDASFVAQQLGISDATLYAVRRFGALLDRPVPPGMLSDQAQESTRGLAQAMQGLSFAFTALKNQVVADLAPAITGIVGVLTRFLNALNLMGGKLSTPTVMAAGLLTMFPAKQSTGNVTHQHNNDVQVSVQIDGAQSPAATAKEVNKSVNRMLSDAYYQSLPP